MDAKFIFFFSNFILLNLNCRFGHFNFLPGYSNWQNPFYYFFSRYRYLYYLFLIIYSFCCTRYDLYHYYKNTTGLNGDQFEIDQTFLLRSKNMERQKKFFDRYFFIVNFIFAAVLSGSKNLIILNGERKNILEKILLALLAFYIKSDEERKCILFLGYLYFLNNFFLNGKHI